MWLTTPNFLGEADPLTQPVPTPKHSGEEKIIACKEGVAQSKAVLADFLEYEVVKKGGAPVREAPDAKSKEVAHIVEGRLVQGHCGGGWLQVEFPADLAGKWIFVGTQLAASCLRVSVKGRFAEALDVHWAGIPQRTACYSVEWRSCSDSNSGVALSLQSETTVSGLPAGGSVRLRISARVSSQAGNVEDALVIGPWSKSEQCQSLEAVATQEEANIDPFGNMRGGCTQAHCQGFLRRVADSSLQSGPNLELSRCARCGRGYQEHQRIVHASVDKPATSKVSEKSAQSTVPDKAFGRANVTTEISGTKIRMRVCHPVVFIRDRPSVKGMAQGTVTRGQLVTGIQYGNWLQLDLITAAALVTHSLNIPPYQLSPKHKTQKPPEN